MAERMPTNINVRNPEPGFRWLPEDGEHANHVMEFVSADALRFNCLGEPLRSWLIRCTVCLQSWTVPPEDGTEP